MVNEWLATLSRPGGSYSQTGFSIWQFAFVFLIVAALLFRVYRSDDPQRTKRLKKVFWLRLSLVFVLLLAIADLAFQKDVFQRQPLLIAIDTSTSSQLPISETDTESRLEAVQNHLEKNLFDNQVWEKLNDLFQIQFVSMDRQLVWPTPDDGSDSFRLQSSFVSQLKADTASSRLGDCLNALVDEKPTSIVLFTDAATTRGISLNDAAQNAASSNIAVHSIGLGSTKAPANLKLSNLQMNRRVRSPSTVPLTVTLEANSLSQSQCTVSVFDLETLESLKEQTIEISSDDFSRQVLLPVPINRPGQLDLLVKVTSLTDEITTDDNQLQVQIDAVEGTVKVLLISDLPSPSYRFLKESIVRAVDPQSNEPLFELSTLLQQASPDLYKIDNTALSSFPLPNELTHFDTVIIGDVNVQEFAANGSNFATLTDSHLESLKEYVEKDFGNVIFVLGPEHAAAMVQSQSLQSLLPFAGRTPTLAAANRTARISFDAAASSLGATQLLQQDQRLIDQQTFYPVVIADTADFGGIPFLSFQFDDVVPPERVPAICLQRVGTGTSITLMSDNFFRMRFRNDGSLYERFWTRLISDLSADRLQSRDQLAILKTDSPVYDVAESIELSVEIFDLVLLEDPSVAAESLTIQLAKEPTTSDSATQAILLYRDDDSPIRPRFRGRLPGLSAGSYVASMQLDSEVSVQCEFQVLAGRTEKQKLTQQVSELQQLAALTSGSYFDFSNADKLWDVLAKVDAGSIVASETISFWSLPWVPAAFVTITILLLATEWLLRRKWRLDP